jgi:hypothetical protein
MKIKNKVTTLLKTGAAPFRCMQMLSFSNSILLSEQEGVIKWGVVIIMNIKRFIGSIAAMGLLAAMVGCASDAKNVNVYHRVDVDTKSSKVIIFPMLLLQDGKLSAGNAEYSNPIAEALLGKSWVGDLGADNAVLVPRMVLDKIPGAWNAVDSMVKVLDVSSVVEQSGDTGKLLTEVTSKFGKGAFAFALVTADKKQFEATKKVQVNMGLFDTQKMTWKWLTKNSYEGGLVPIPYEKVVQDLVAQSYDALKAKTGGAVR